MMYEASTPSRYTLADCEGAVGERATLALTGTIIEAGESKSGAWVRFELDERWGFPSGSTFVVDLDALGDR